MSVTSYDAISPGDLAVVTGAASGIGLATAKAFAARDMRVALIDRPAPRWMPPATSSTAPMFTL